MLAPRHHARPAAGPTCRATIDPRRTEQAVQTTTFKDYETQALAQGYDAVVDRAWAPDTVVDEHTHPFAAKAVVVDGEMWLTVGDHTRHLTAGDDFELDALVPHSERYGPQGARYWVARKTPV
jgi:quercetin dioxygenase-like cupin family protein